MNKYLIGINGMKCGMCEVHIEETIDKALKVKRVKANRNKNLLTVHNLQSFRIPEERGQFHK